MNKIKIDKIIKMVNEKGNGTKILSNICNMDIKDNTVLNFQCCCGKYFCKKYSQIRDQKYLLCSECVIKKRSEKKRISFDIVESHFKNRGYKILSEYKNNNAKLLVIDEEGYMGYLTYNHSLYRDDSIIKFSLKYNRENFIYNLNNYGRINKYKSIVIDIDEFYSDNRTGIVVKCECGREFKTTYLYYLAGGNRCEYCVNSLSLYENLIEKYLKEKNIKYIHNYRFEDCRDKLPLPFDYYLTDYDILLEIDGEGHYYPCNFNQISNEDAELTFKTTKNHDRIKNDYCKKNGYKLYRIPFWEIKNSEQYKDTINRLLIS